MEELQKIIEGFRKAEKACRQLSKDCKSQAYQQYFLGKADVFQEVVEVLEGFMTRYSVFAVKVWEIQEKRAQAMQSLAEDLERERSN